MSRGYLGLNVLLAIASVLFATQIGRGVVVPQTASGAVSRKPVAPAAPGAPLPVADGAVEGRPPLASYGSIPAKNLFAPSRSEGATSTAGAATGPKPFLYGVVLRDDLSIAYLEDPASKRVAGYRVGDMIAVGTLAAIAPDYVVLTRPDGPVEVKLRDPSKPRPAEAATQAGTPGAPPGAPPAGAIRPPVPAAPPGSVPAPPTLLRRLPAPPGMPFPPAARDEPGR